MYNDVFIKIFVALFGCKPEVPDNFRAARLLYARLRGMTTRIGDGEFDAMVSRLRIEIRLAWATVAEMYEEVASGGALEGDMVIQRLHPKPEQCFLKYDHTVPYREQELTIWSAELGALIEAMHAALAKFEPYASGGDHREFPELFRSAWGDLLRSFGLNPTPRYSPKPVYPKIITRKLHGRALPLTRDVLWWHNAPHEAERRLRDFRNPYALANKLFREEAKRRAKAKAKAEARAAAERRGEVYTSHSSSEDEGGSVPTFAEAMGVRAVCVPRPSLLVSVCASLKPCAVAALPCELFRGPSAHKPEEFQRPRVRGAIRPGAWHVTLAARVLRPRCITPCVCRNPRMTAPSFCAGSRSTCSCVTMCAPANRSITPRRLALRGTRSVYEPSLVGGVRRRKVLHRGRVALWALPLLGKPRELLACFCSWTHHDIREPGLSV